MYRFIDIKNGRPFNGDSPYIFWFDDGQSTNISYVKIIYMFSEKEYLGFKMESKPDQKFWILKIDQRTYNNNPIIIDNLEYLDLSTLALPNENGDTTFTSNGFPLNTNNPGGADEGYVHALYILTRSKDAGEYVDKFQISDDNNVWHDHMIGADFYAENEILKSNLENLEISLPESIQKSIYETNVHEEANDNIVLNKKYKELLMNYWDIIANKGSYKSLVNSLNWFEYADLVKIKEYWKQASGFNKYVGRDIQNFVQDEIESQISSMVKTTYIGLYFALQKLSKLSTGHIEYEDSLGRDINISPSLVALAVDNGSENVDPNTQSTTTDETTNVQESQGANWQITEVPGRNYIYNELNPKLYHVAAIWSGIDLSIKMTLLGNFYSTFFAPIHIDVIHSTIESLVYAATQKLINTGGDARIDRVNLMKTYTININYE